MYFIYIYIVISTAAVCLSVRRGRHAACGMRRHAACGRYIRIQSREYEVLNSVISTFTFWSVTFCLSTFTDTEFIDVGTSIYIQWRHSFWKFDDISVQNINIVRSICNNFPNNITDKKNCVNNCGDKYNIFFFILI